VRAQIAERDQQIAHKDALIAQLMQQGAKAGPPANGCPAPEVQKSAGSGGGGGIFSKLRTNLVRGSVRAPLPLNDRPLLTTCAAVQCQVQLQCMCVHPLHLDACMAQPHS
jgi:hypothetical protein